MAKYSQTIRDDETLDDLLRGDLKVLQKRDGYRFSIDAVLLANFVGSPKAESIIDLGTGCGIIPILLAHKTKQNRIVGVEVQSDLAEMATRSVELNNLSSRVTIINEDLTNLRQLFKAGTFDMVLSNPPYRKANSGRVNPHSQKAIARHEIKSSLQDIVEIAGYLLKPRGKVCLVFPVARLGELISSLRDTKLEPKKLQIVYPNLKSEGKLVLIEASKDGRVGLNILQPLISSDLHGDLPSHLLEISEA
ncbi:MAG: tRNA1(Val) (adenine(37)-N6)-methyltransferase [Pseudomonadota bacterium]